jgi:hypothetical protein
MSLAILNAKELIPATRVSPDFNADAKHAAKGEKGGETSRKKRKSC